jgi:hypothetical protein
MPQHAKQGQMNANFEDLVYPSFSDGTIMKGQSIHHIKRLPLQIFMAISIMVLICQSGTSRGFWTDADQLIHSIEKRIYSDSNMDEISPFVQDDQMPANLAKGAPTQQPDGNLAEEKELSLEAIDHSPNRYYVSRFGNNRDGLSWETAWNELDQINWEVIDPGDSILLDGGRFEMVYTSRLTVAKSGVYKMPITIRMATESGRNGQVVIFGGRSTPLPYCHQYEYTFQTEGVGKIGILIDSASWIVIDGTRWSGIVIHGHNEHGIQLTQGSDNITMRNIEVYDNGIAKRWGLEWNPDSAGIFFSGSNLTFERFIVHDNGQDAFQSGGGNENFILRNSWLYNSRRHPTVNESFNYCSHTDGIQIYNGNRQGGFLIEHSIIGPGFTNGLILGSVSQSRQTYAVIDDVTLRDVLLTKAADNNILSYPKTQPKGWILDHVTVDCSNTKYECLYLTGSDHQVTNSIFWGAEVFLSDTQIVADNNCQWNTTGSKIGQIADPLFTDMNFNHPFSLDNYALTPDSPCEGLGSDLTSVGQLFGQKDPDRVLEGLSWDAAEGYVTFPFLLRQGTIYQQIETDHPALGGRASFRFNITSAGQYIVAIRADAPNTASNSFFVNIDDEPTASDMIWDIEVTQGFEERFVSWRGNGSDLENEYSPKVFELDSGTHELIIVGRESYVCILEVNIIQVYENQDIGEYRSGIGCCLTPRTRGVGHTSGESNFFIRQ